MQNRYVWNLTIQSHNKTFVNKFYKNIEHSSILSTLLISILLTEMTKQTETFLNKFYSTIGIFNFDLVYSLIR